MYDSYGKNARHIQHATRFTCAPPIEKSWPTIAIAVAKREDSECAKGTRTAGQPLAVDVTAKTEPSVEV
jgi:hypothetical protein